MYSASVPLPSAAVIGLVPRARVPKPVTPAALAHAVACIGLIRFDGSGRCRVRAIAASWGTSMIWLNELADAAHRKVPPSAAPIVAGQTVLGAMTWPAAVVITTSPLRRLFDSSMYTPSHCTKVVGGFSARPVRIGVAAAAMPQGRAASRSIKASFAMLSAVATGLAKHLTDVEVAEVGFTTGKTSPHQKGGGWRIPRLAAAPEGRRLEDTSPKTQTNTQGSIVSP